MYKKYDGSWKDIMSKTVYHAVGSKFIPCMVTNYYFKEEKYALVPIEDLEKYGNQECSKRRIFFVKKIYVACQGGGC